MTVYAPYILSGGKIEPYISVTELENSPTASALDLTDLIPGGSAQVQADALYQLIVRASSKIDAYVMGKYGSLNATSNTENGRYRQDRYGRFKIHPSFTPVLAVSSFAWGPIMGTTAAIPLSAQNCWIERDEIVIQASGAVGTVSYSGTGALGYIAGAWGQDYYCEWTYVNGWANSFTTAASLANATSLALTDPTGVYPGQTLFVWDGQYDEQVLVASSYVPGTSTVTFANPLTYPHASGTNVSALPATVKQACIHFVCAMVTERGQSGIGLGSAGEVIEAGQASKGLGFEHDVAGFDLLDTFRVSWGRM